MWQESNVNLRSQRTILRYLTNEFGTRLVVPETEISKLGQHFVEPKCDYFIMEKKKKFWTKSVPTIVLTYLKHKLGDSVQIDSVRSIELVIGGDHGQGKFRSVMKIILRDASGKNIDSFCVKIGHIDFDKDTYHVLKNSVTKPLNDDIKVITDSGSVQFITNLTTKEKSIVFDTVDEIDEEKISIQKSVPIRIWRFNSMATPGFQELFESRIKTSF